MDDKDIYQEIAQALFNSAPDISVQNTVFAYVTDTSTSICAWIGDKKINNNTYLPDRNTGVLLDDLFRKLREYYIENNMGEWNVALFKLAPNGKSFEISFEQSLELDSGSITVTKFRKKYE